jgi:hypothetical protein
MLTCGIVGLPMVGKTTLFNLVTHSELETSNYLTGKTEINVAMAEVPDTRLDFLINLFKPKKNFPFMLVLRFDESVKKEVQNVLRKMPQGRLKSKVVSQGTMELTIEMNIREDEVGMIDAFSGIPGVHDASLISYKGDIV